MGDAIDKLIEEVIVDAYGGYEQLSSFCQVFEDDARFPFRCQVVGVEVEVTAVDFDGDDRRGLLAKCRRAGEPYTVSLLDVSPVGPLPLRTRQLLDAYRRWSGATPLAGEPSGTSPWMYPRLSTVGIDIPTPLALQPRGDWDPAEEYWGEPGDPLPALWEEVITAGVRPCFEMEQVLPGVEPDDWDRDPIVDAAELHRAGHHRDAAQLLERLLAIDIRCVDAWGHLGLIAFGTRGPGPARELYETGVAIAERSLPDGFGGVLPWGWVDNRPFIAWLHIAGHRYTRYVVAARRLGSDHWQPIVALVESALAAGRHQLAVDVFRAADRPGMHREHLRQRCLALTGKRLDDPPAHLRIAE